ncbi:hypothetical protein [Bacillus thuringiensis]|nr:hypothetical protein [Bacillus thuringiensis]
MNVLTPPNLLTNVNKLGGAPVERTAPSGIFCEAELIIRALSAVTRRLSK